MTEPKLDVTNGREQLEPLAEKLGISLDALTEILMLCPVGDGLTETPINSEFLLTDDEREIVDKLDAGADQADVPGAEDLAKVAGVIAINNYFLDVAKHSKKYEKEIRENIATLSQDIEPGEDLAECLRRTMKKYSLTVVLVPLEEPDNVFGRDFTPILNNAVSNELVTLNRDVFTPIPDTKTATYTSDKGTKYTIKNFENWNLSTGAKKLFIAALQELTATNVHRTPVRRAMIEIDLLNFGEALGRNLHSKTMKTTKAQAEEDAQVAERIKDFKKTIRKWGRAVKEVEYSREETRGYNKGDFNDMNTWSALGIRTGADGRPKIHINFDVEAAQYYNDSYISWFPNALYKTDNRNPNTFPIGCKIAFQNAMDNNVAKGTDTTIGVRSLLEVAPDIVKNLEDLKTNRGRYDWRTQIKTPLERSLANLVNVEYLERWNYRDPKTGKIYTPKTAARLSWEVYHNLVIDFWILPDNPQREERTIERRAAKEAALASTSNDTPAEGGE